MNARATVLTLSTTLALIAPATQAAAAGNAPGCGPQTKRAATNARTSRNSLFSPQDSRGLQYLTLGDGTATSQPARTTCGVTNITSLIAPNHYQVARDAL